MYHPQHLSHPGWAQLGRLVSTLPANILTPAGTCPTVASRAGKGQMPRALCSTGGHSLSMGGGPSVSVCEGQSRHRTIQARGAPWLSPPRKGARCPETLKRAKCSIRPRRGGLTPTWEGRTRLTTGQPVCMLWAQDNLSSLPCSTRLCSGGGDGTGPALGRRAGCASVSQVRPPGGGSAPRPTPREGRKQPSCQPVAAPQVSPTGKFQEQSRGWGQSRGG